MPETRSSRLCALKQRSGEYIQHKQCSQCRWRRVRRRPGPQSARHHPEPRNQSKANIISSTPEREKHAMRPIADLPGATRYHQGRCSVCKARFNGRAPKVNKYCVPCSDISRGKLVCVCSRKSGAAETDDSCYSYHTRHPHDFIYSKPEFLDPDKEQ